jgi:beta-glucosidase
LERKRIDVLSTTKTSKMNKQLQHKFRFFLVGMIFIGLFTPGCQPPGSSSSDASYNPEMNAFVTDLMGKMTLEEKIGQLNLVSVGFDVTGPRLSENVEEKIERGLVGGVFNTFTPIAVKKLQQKAVEETRLGIPLLFGYDVIHGHRTIFPIPLGMSCSWDLEAIEQSARMAIEEATADGLCWVFSPMVDIARDPRWGRVSEGAGEDAWYGSQVAAAMVRGIQGDDLTAENTAMACVKHFAMYGAAEAGRDYNTVDMSRMRMYEDYLPPYKAAIDEGALTVMSSFNEINGVPATGNRWLMNELLRNEWGFKGFVVSDYTAVEEMIPHGYAKNMYEAAQLGLLAGNDMDMVSEAYLEHFNEAIRNGDIAESDIDRACRRILEAKYKLGLFEDPYRYVNEQKPAMVHMQPSHIEAAREVGRKSIVLLKNESQLLPLSKTGTIALIGPLAKSQRDMIGNWSGAGDWQKAVSLEQGIRNVVGDKVKIRYALGANFTDDEQMINRLNRHGGKLQIDDRPPEKLIAEAVRVARRSDVIVAVVGESQGMSGEAASRADITLPGTQLELLKALKETGKPLVVVLMNGRPLALKWEAEHADAILETWFAGTEAGNAIADVLFGDFNPSGKLTMTFPQVVGQVPLYYNHKPTGRPFGGEWYDKFKTRYMDVTNEPLYPFGYGLSYTTFDLSAPRLNKQTLSATDTLTVEVEVSNTGTVEGTEVVQIYVRDMFGSVTRPVKELKGFERVTLKVGETRTVTFNITVQDLKFFNEQLVYDWEPGDFQIMTGNNSAEVQSASITWEK